MAIDFGSLWYVEVVSGGIASGEFVALVGHDYPPIDRVLFTLVGGSL